MMAKLQDTIEVADVTEHVNRLAEKIRSKDPTAAGAPPRASGTGARPSGNGGVGGGGSGAGVGLEEQGPGQQAFFAGEGSRSGGGSDAWGGFAPAAPGPGPPSPGAEGSATGFGGAAPGPAAGARGAGGGGGLEGCVSSSSLALSGRAGSLLGPEVSYGALAAAADTLDDKLAVVEHKRRWVPPSAAGPSRGGGRIADGRGAGLAECLLIVCAGI
jgi:hypothetical protein